MVLEKLQGSGVPRAYVEAAFARPEVKLHEEIPGFFDHPAEALPYEEYRRRIITDARIAGGVRFRETRKTELAAVARAYGVDEVLMTGLVGVESSYGTNRGKYTVFNSLYTIIRLVPKRSRWAAGELAEYLKYCHADRVDPQGILGSYAGAFGYGQFIPSSFNRLAVDFDGDGVRRHDSWPDVLASIANYWVKNGYEPGSLDFSRDSSIWKALFAYNHSDNYVNVVIDLRAEILARRGPGA